MLVATQRPSFVNKNVLSQCNNQIIGKLSIENDLRAVDLFFSSRKEVEELSNLRPGEFFVMGKFTPKKTRITFALRETTHRGMTPLLIPHSLGTPVVSRTPRATLQVSHPIEPKRRGEPPQGLPRSISPEQALEIAHRKRKRGFLGRKEEHLISVEPVYWPIISVEGKYLGGLLHTTPRNITFLLDGRGARLLRITSGLIVQSDLSSLCGLSSDTVRVFRYLPLKGATNAELEVKTKIPPSVIRQALHHLLERKLITEAGTRGTARLYVPLIKVTLPRLRSLQHRIDRQLVSVEEELKECTVQEGDIRSILKGMEPTAEILSWFPWYYPLYEIVLSSHSGERRVYVDGVAGKPVSFMA